MPANITEDALKVWDTYDESKRQRVLSKRSPEDRAAIEGAYAKWKAAKPTQLGAVARGAAEGATFGFSGEANAAADTLGMSTPEKVAATLNPMALIATVATRGAQRLLDDKPIAEDYNARREVEEAKIKRAKDEYPTKFLGGEIGGALATAAVPGGAAARGVKLGTKLLRGAARGAAEGGASSVGHAEGTLPTAEDALWDTLLGGGLGSAGEGVGAGLSWLSKKVKRVAESQAFKATHPTLKRLRQIPQKMQQKIGRTLLDKKIVGWGSSADDIAKSAGDLRNQVGAQLADIASRLDDEARKQGRFLDPQTLVGRVRTEAQKRFPAPSQDKEIRKLIDEELADFLETYDINNPAASELSFRNLQLEKSGSQRKGVSHSAVVPEKTMASKFFGHQLKEGFEKSAQQADPALRKELDEANELYSALAPSEDIAADAVLRDEATRGPALRTWLAYGAGGAPGAMAEHFWRTRGNAATAKALDALSNRTTDDSILQLLNRMGFNAGANLQAR